MNSLIIVKYEYIYYNGIMKSFFLFILILNIQYKYNN